MSCQAQLMEVCQLKQKLEETLRQRERELTALKGALKEEVATHDKEIEALREQYNVDMEKLRSSMEQVSQVCAPPPYKQVQKRIKSCQIPVMKNLHQFRA